MVAEGLELERQLLAKLRRVRHPLDGILKTKLLPYQERGAIFAACRGRVVLADDMGLGKTVQTLAATELLRRRRGIQKVLVVAPASVKYQWKTEIEKFSGLSAQVIEGLLPRRRELSASPKFFNLSSYELVMKDVRYMHELAPDLIILDEAQRIRNWTTATARTIKQLKSRYAFVLRELRSKQAGGVVLRGGVHRWPPAGSRVPLLRASDGGRARHLDRLPRT
jgi:SNF2 family DNA or RNA helicase